jgi:hypothetical protein
MSQAELNQNKEDCLDSTRNIQALNLENIKDLRRLIFKSLLSTLITM